MVYLDAFIVARVKGFNFAHTDSATRAEGDLGHDNTRPTNVNRLDLTAFHVQ